MEDLRTKQIQAIKEIIVPYWTGERERSYCENQGVCLYNGPNNAHCAFAFACTPLARKEILVDEGKSIREFFDEFGESRLLKKKYIGLFTIAQWQSIQHAHDDYFGMLEIGSIGENKSEIWEGRHELNSNRVAIQIGKFLKGVIHLTTDEITELFELK